MARFVEPDRLLPLIVYFAAAVLLLIVARWAAQAVELGSGVSTGLLVAWFLLVPVGAVLLWLRKRPRR